MAGKRTELGDKTNESQRENTSDTNGKRQFWDRFQDARTMPEKNLENKWQTMETFGDKWETRRQQVGDTVPRFQKPCRKQEWETKQME